MSKEESAHVFGNFNDGTFAGCQYRAFYAIGYLFGVRGGSEFRKLQVWMFKWERDNKEMRMYVQFDMSGSFKNTSFLNQKPRPGQYEGVLDCMYVVCPSPYLLCRLE